MKKLYVLALLMVLSITAMAQTIIVEDKDGNRVPYDPAKITSIEFQATPPGFVINKDGETINFTYDVTKSILGNPNHVFVDPETVNVDGEGKEMAVQVKANVDFDVTTSASWVIFDSEAKDGICYVKVAMNPSVDERTGTVVLTSKDGTLTSTLNIVQAGKEDSRYISVDWEKDKLESYDPETGIAKITFAEEVPIMGEYDIVMVPDEMGTLMIRIIEEVTEVTGKTVTLNTTQGDMGNLFRDQEITFELGGDGTAGSRRVSGSKPVFSPEKVEILEDGKYVEVYNANSRARRAPSTQELTLDYEDSDIMLESWGNLTFKIQKAKLAMKFKGTLEFSFERRPWYKVWKGHTTKASVLLEGDSEGETVLDISCRTPNEMSGNAILKPDEMMRLKTGVVQRRYTFNVEGVPVQVVLDGEVRCNHGYQCLGLGDAVGGHKYSKHFKYGLTCVDDNLDGDFIYEEKPTFNLIYPEENIGSDEYKNSQCRGRATVIPYFKINFYGQYCRTDICPAEWTYVNPRSWLPYPDEAPDDIARRSMVERWASTFIYMGSVPGWLLDHSAGESFDSGDHTQILFYNPWDFTLETPSRDLMQDDEQDIEITAFHYDYTTNEQLTSIGALVAFEIEGSASGDKKLLLKYTDENGKAKVTFKKGEPSVERVNIKLCKSAVDSKEYGRFVEKKWTSKLLKYNIQCLNPSQEVEKGAEAVPVHFLLQKTEGNDLSAWAHKRVEFVATNGTVTPTINYTDENGLITAYFTPTNSAPEGEVLAIVTEEGNKKNWEGRATGKIIIKGGGGGGGGGGDVFDKAKKLDDNVYVVSDKDGNESTRGLLQDWSQWNRGKAGCDGETRVIKISLEDGKTDPATGSVETQGGGYFEIPIDKFGEPMQLLLDYLSNYGAIQGSFFTFKNPDEGYSSSNYLNLKFGCGDMHNLKSGTVQLQKKGGSANARALAPRRALEEDYSGELELVFAFTFTNYIFENGEETEDGEFTVYGKAVVNENTPKITYFKLEPESGFVGIGKSVEVNVKEYYDEDAVWNWDDVEMVASYVDYSNYETDEGYFLWDPATHSLTSLKTNNNESVYVRFRLKSNPELTSYFTIRTGDGWPYTAFTISPVEQTVERAYTCQFNVESWEPADIGWDPYAIEIDPATNPGAYNKYFIYEPSFPRLKCSYAAQPGTYNVRMRLMSDHSVGFTMKITVTE